MWLIGVCVCVYTRVKSLFSSSDNGYHFSHSLNIRQNHLATLAAAKLKFESDTERVGKVCQRSNYRHMYNTSRHSYPHKYIHPQQLGH